MPSLVVAVKEVLANAVVAFAFAFALLLIGTTTTTTFTTTFSTTDAFTAVTPIFTSSSKHGHHTNDLPSSSFTSSFTTSSSSFTSSSLRMVSNGIGSSSSSSSFAKDLLYQDQQLAMERRALEEEELMGKQKELKAPKLKAKPPKSGKGFGGGGGKSNDDDDSIGARLAVEQAKIIKRDGVLRIPNALSGELADQLKDYVLKQQELAAIAVEQSKNSGGGNNVLRVSKSFYGVENSRQSRCDLQLSLLRGGYARDNNYDDEQESQESKQQQEQPHTVADVLYELLGTDHGTLRHLYENLVTPQGEFYELAAVITNPGSKRQQVHPDLPFQKKAAPLYVIFLALQDVTPEMGPTTFLLKTHNNEELQTKQFSMSAGNLESKNKVLQNADCRLSTLRKGDAVLFDARVLHCGNANDLETGSTRVLFNFSFRNPEIEGNLGYPGSIRPGYCGAMTLQDVTTRVDAYYQNDNNNNNNAEPFAEYGDGLLR